jgi:hypothetical protein
MTGDDDAPRRSHGRKQVRPSLQPRDLMAEDTLAGVWTAQVITLVPQAFPGVLGESLTGRALKDALWQLQVIDLRAFGHRPPPQCRRHARGRRRGHGAAPRRDGRRDRSPPAKPRPRLARR